MRNWKADNSISGRMRGTPHSKKSSRDYSGSTLGMKTSSSKETRREHGLIQVNYPYKYDKKTNGSSSSKNSLSHSKNVQKKSRENIRSKHSHNPQYFNYLEELTERGKKKQDRLTLPKKENSQQYSALLNHNEEEEKYELISPALIQNQNFMKPSIVPVKFSNNLILKKEAISSPNSFRNNVGWDVNEDILSIAPNPTNKIRKMDKINERSQQFQSFKKEVSDLFFQDLHSDAEDKKTESQPKNIYSASKKPRSANSTPMKVSSLKNNNLELYSIDNPSIQTSQQISGMTTYANTCRHSQESSIFEGDYGKANSSSTPKLTITRLNNPQSFPSDDSPSKINPFNEIKKVEAKKLEINGRKNIQGKKNLNLDIDTLTTELEEIQEKLNKSEEIKKGPRSSNAYIARQISQTPTSSQLFSSFDNIYDLKNKVTNTLFNSHEGDNAVLNLSNQNSNQTEIVTYLLQKLQKKEEKLNQLEKGQLKKEPVLKLQHQSLSRQKSSSTTSLFKPKSSFHSNNNEVVEKIQEKIRKEKYERHSKLEDIEKSLQNIQNENQKLRVENNSMKEESQQVMNNMNSINNTLLQMNQQYFQQIQLLQQQLLSAPSKDKASPTRSNSMGLYLGGSNSTKRLIQNFKNQALKIQAMSQSPNPNNSANNRSPTSYQNLISNKRMEGNDSNPYFCFSSRDFSPFSTQSIGSISKENDLQTDRGLLASLERENYELKDELKKIKLLLETTKFELHQEKALVKHLKDEKEGFKKIILEQNEKLNMFKLQVLDHFIHSKKDLSNSTESN